jgi:hypothetical protein
LRKSTGHGMRLYTPCPTWKCQSGLIVSIRQSASISER